ncbi:MAG: TlyA family RNA methyltransferase [Acholeplasmataceae bacterium]
MRIDQYLLEKKFVKSRSQAADLIKRNYILINGNAVKKAGLEVKSTDQITILQKKTFVSRAGEKLDHFLNEINYDITDKVIVDVGSSTGGFTDCVIQRGAKHVYCFDVGSDQMDRTLSQHHKISLFEKTNILKAALDPVDLVLIDVSFTSILPIVKYVSNFTREIIALIKPQFEVGKGQAKKGIVKQKDLRDKVISNLIEAFSTFGLKLVDLQESQVIGKKGNQEYFMYLVSKTMTED